MHDFNMFRALCSDSISVRFAAWHVQLLLQDALDLGTTMQCVAVERPASGLPVMRGNMAFSTKALPPDVGEHGLQHTHGCESAPDTVDL